MIKPRSFLLFALALVCSIVPGPVHAQDAGDAAAGNEAKTLKNVYKPRLIAIPFIYYSPETKLAFGVGGVLNFRAGRRKDETRPSTVWAFGTYNRARQFQVVVKPEIYFERNSFFLSGNIRYERTPQNFFGIGNDMPPTAEESYTPRIVTIQLGLKKRFLGHFFAGVLTPRKGVFFQLAADTYGAMTGSDFTFTSLKLDCRKYFLVASDQVLALQAYIRSTAGEVPFHQLAFLGGESLMRGYYKGRFRDKDILAVQAEYRVFVTKTISVAGCAGLADVFPAFAEFKLKTIKYAVGTGVRYMVNKHEGTNLRLDMAWGKASFGLYVTAQEAF